MNTQNAIIDDMTDHPDVNARTDALLAETWTVLKAMEQAIPDLYSAEGLYQAFAREFLPVPYLWECRDELAAAVRLQTQLIRGSVILVYPDGRPIPAAERIAAVSPNHPPRSWDPRDL
jgi:hypothetical protein